jgi:hypothetical protein
MASKPKKGAAKGDKLFRPWLCVIGIVFLWASENQPPDFTPASLAIWVLSSIAVGLIAGAILAFIQPLILVYGRMMRDMADARAERSVAEETPAAGTDEP